MADSIRERIVAAAAAAIDAKTLVPVYRSRVEALTRRQAPAIVVEPGPDTLSDAISSCRLDWRLDLMVAVYATGSIPDKVADPVVQDVHSALMADRSLGGLSWDILPVSVDPQLEGGDPPASWTVTRWQVRYRTSLTDISSAS